MRYQCLRYQELTVYFVEVEAWPRGYKNFSMLNSTEHEISNGRKYINIKKFRFFGSDKPRMLLFLLINVIVPTTVGTLTYMSRENLMQS